jgi:molybdate transport system substrate-binding protein
MKITRFLLLAAILTAGNAAAAFAAEIKVLGANPLQEGLHLIAERYKRETGHDVNVQIATTGELNKILAAGAGGADILIGTTEMADQLVKENKVAGSKIVVARVGIGVIVRSGAPVPNVATAEAIKQAALAADGVVYNTAGSGQSVQRMFDQMGISEQIKAKSARPGNAAQTMDRMMQGKGNEIGFGLLSEIKPYEGKGIQLAGRLPENIQAYTNYEAVVFAGSKAAGVAKEFIQHLATPAAKQIFASTGVD